jgi:hypothetical protein
LLKEVATVTIDTAENYQKKSARNRYSILSANGPITLSVPLKKGKANQLNIKDVLIAYDEDWVSNHLSSIRSAYGKSAYFEHYYGPLEQILNRKPTTLHELNLALLKFVLKALRWEKPIMESEYFLKSFTTPEINKPYPQVFEEKYGFVSDLSILDLLFNMGPEAGYYL